MKIFIGKSYGSGPTAELIAYEVQSFWHFCETYIRCYVGRKNEYYITIGDNYTITKGDKTQNAQSYKYNDHYHRNNESQLTAWLLPFDGDCSINNPESCIPPFVAHQILCSYNINHIVYSTYSHVPGIRNRWRCFVPCRMTDQAQLAPTVHTLFSILQAHAPEIGLSNESKTWSNAWFLPTTDDLLKFERYTYYIGYDLKPSEPLVQTSVPAIMHSNTPAEIISVIRSGAHPLHENIRNYAWGAVNDGRPPAWVKAELHAFTAAWNLNDKRLFERKKDIDRIVDTTYQKIFKEELDYIKIDDTNNRIYTKYPEQTAVFEAMVQVCMSWMHFPNRQLAVTSIHALISTLGGRVYTFPNSSGIVYTALITGRSTIGKSNIKSFIVFVLNNFSELKIASEFVGSHFYTSSANLVKELNRYGTILSVRTESGQTDQSQAGDMKRVMLYELELATQHGQTGYVSSGGQNEKVPDLYSPAVTTIRESVAEIQNQADLFNQSSVSGVSGRRSHVVIDPVKTERNRNRLTALPGWFKSIINELYKLAKNTCRHNISEPIAAKNWIFIDIEDDQFLKKKETAWLEQENKSAELGNHFEATFYGRLPERVPAYAARLAVVENPLKPIVTNAMLDIAEASLKAELLSHTENVMKSPWELLLDEIKTLFVGRMADNIRLKKCEPKELLKENACDWVTIRNLIRHKDCYKELSSKSNFHSELENRLKHEGIFRMKPDEAMKYSRKNARIIYCK